MTTPPSASAIIDATITERVEDRGRDFSPFVAHVAASPRDHGTLRALVRRPERDRREILEAVELDPIEGVVGDSWLARGSARTPDGSANPDSQVTLMSVRVLAAIEPDESRWVLAGDQLLVDFDLSLANLPIGAHLVVGEAELVISADPHTGCAKLSGRFGSDALRWINGAEGRERRYRGVNARVVRGGTVRVGDEVRKA
jgi:MOSC domain-containing protein YiiM